MRAFDVLDVEQRSVEWFQARLGVLTGSVASAIVAKGKGKEESVVRRNLRIKLALERVTGRLIDDGIPVTFAMQAGIDREALALGAYQAATGELVSRCGFCRHKALRVGCSPDAYLGDFDKLVSVKCRQPAAHLEFIRYAAIPAEAFVQMQHEAWVTGAQEVDYVCWNPDFPVSLQLRLITVPRAVLDIPGYEAEALRFLDEVKAEAGAIQALAEREGAPYERASQEV